MSSAPKTVSWSAQEHTFAKHRILRRYLGAWLPIMSTQASHLVLVDGFAGPGRYEGGEEGSPLVMLRTYLNHDSVEAMAGTQFTFLFVEQNAARYTALAREIAALKDQIPPNVSVVPVQGAFADVMADRAVYLSACALAAPTFLFIDPFGYKQTHLAEVGTFLAFPRSEVFVYLPISYMARFIDNEDYAAYFTNVYGDERWRRTRVEPSLQRRREVLRDEFAAAMRPHAAFVQWFEMIGRRPNTGYHLFFGSNSKVGLRRMKEAMWSVDPFAGTTFRDEADANQLAAFNEPLFGDLLTALFRQFGLRPFSIDAAADFTLIETPFRDDAHLKSKALAPAEAAGVVSAVRPGGGSRGYPTGTVVQFRQDPRATWPNATASAEVVDEATQPSLWGAVG